VHRTAERGIKMNNLIIGITLIAIAIGILVYLKIIQNPKVTLREAIEMERKKKREEFDINKYALPQSNEQGDGK